MATPIHMIVGWNSPIWPADWLNTTAMTVINAYAGLDMISKDAAGTWVSYARGDPANYDFPLTIGEQIWLYANSEFDLLVECVAGTVETETCLDGSTNVVRTCDPYLQWQPSGTVCAVQPNYYPLIFVAGVVVLGSIALLLIRK